MTIRENDAILPLDSPALTLENSGGKGLNLGRLVRLGFPVPEGFVVNAAVYRTLAEGTGLARCIDEALGRLAAGDAAALEREAAGIRAEFAKRGLPDSVALEIKSAWEKLGRPAVAVRSSATAEDLPELSFAGQQDTFLNVTGADALIAAIVACLASLWTERAVAYRAAHNVGRAGIAMAVVVQALVPSETSGVMFTANPLSGSRRETVIEAISGLGEALVSGRVEPDRFVLNSASGRLVARTIGRQSLEIRPRANGGVEENHLAGDESTVLPREQLAALCALGARIEAAFGSPQDIEWALAAGRLSILQSRPITSLFPLPDGLPADPLRVLFSFANVQGVMDPLTPLGRNIFQMLFAAGARRAGFRWSYRTQTIARTAGARIWVDITPLLKSTLGRKATALMRFVEPGALENLRDIINEPDSQPPRRPTARAFRRLASFLFPIARLIFGNWLRPERAVPLIAERIAALHRLVEREAAGWETLADCSRSLVGMERLMYRLLPQIISGVATGMGPLFILLRLARRLSGGEELALKATRGAANNVTTEMDLALWETARRIKADEKSCAYFSATAPADCAAAFLAATLPAKAQTALETFFKTYGMRGFAEIDIGRPRWREEPRSVIEAIIGYLAMENPAYFPDAVFRKSEDEARSAAQTLLGLARRSRGASFLVPVLRWALRRVRLFIGFRESPKFAIVRSLGVCRAFLLAEGGKRAAAGTLDRADDLFYLNLWELERFAAGADEDWGGLIRERRSAFERERGRKLLPRLILSDGRAFYEGMRRTDGQAIAGSPVSPGLVEGRVRVVLTPQNAALLPGEILVCPGTDPSWTPLFLTAGGLIMEVGGLMTHGAVVAREYGIPAVVGVTNAVTRLRTGQRVRLDGTSGFIDLLDEEDDAAAPAG